MKGFRRASMFLAILVMLAAPAAVRALPVAGAYPSKMNSLGEPNDLERDALARIQSDRRAQGLPELEWDGLLSAIAREHAEDMAINKYTDYVSPRLGPFDYRLHRSGISTANTRFSVLKVGSTDEMVAELKQMRFHLAPATHIGIGVVAQGSLPRRLYAAVITREKFTTLEPFPTQPVYGRAYRLAGIFEKDDLRDAMLIVTLPNGKVEERALPLDARRRFDSLVRFDQGHGKYTVEITASGEMGPTVLDLMHVYAGVGYPAVPKIEPPIDTPDDPRRAERIVFDLINRARRDARLPPLKYSDPLAAVARLHSDDMSRHDFFAHVSPTAGDLSARMARAGIKGRRFTENIAANQDLGAAHRGLMDSPGHRKNILDPDVTHVGVGVVKQDHHLVVTENFMQEFRAFDTEDLAGDTLRLLNEARAKERLPALRVDATLRRIALANSRAMMADGKLGYEKAKAELERARVDFQYVQMAVLQSTDPPAADTLQEALKARYDVVGIGMVQSTAPGGERFLWTTMLLGDK